MEEFFADNANPSAAQKASLAEQSNLTAQQVSRWFENRRKRARRANAEPATEGGDPADPPVPQAPETIILDDEDAEMTADDPLIRQEQLDRLKQAPSTTAAEPAACIPEQPAEEQLLFQEQLDRLKQAPSTATAEPAACIPEQAAPSQTPAAKTAARTPEQQAGPSEAPAAVSAGTKEQLEQLKEEIRVLESYVTSWPYPIIPLDKAKMELCMDKWQVGSFCPSSSASDSVTLA